MLHFLTLAYLRIMEFSLFRENIDIKFPCDSKKQNLPLNYFEIENRLKEARWKKDRIREDLLREQGLLDHAKSMFEAKKQEFVNFLADSSSYATQVIPQVCSSFPYSHLFHVKLIKEVFLPRVRLT